MGGPPILAGRLATMGGRRGICRAGSCGGRRGLRLNRPAVQDRAAIFRARVEFLDAVARPVLTMTPTERREFDALMKGDVVPKR